MGRFANPFRMVATTFLVFSGVWLWSSSSVSTMIPGARDSGFVPIDIGEDEDLLVARYAVTVREWSECVDAGICQSRPAQLVSDTPVTNVNWLDAQQYIAWRSARDDVAYRLPTHAEWVLMAAEQAPAPLEKLFDAPELAWAADYNINAQPLATAEPDGESALENSFGLVGLQDSVWEWTDSCRETTDGDSEDCHSARIAMGTHLSILPELVSDPSKAGCGAGNPLPYVGFRLIKTHRRVFLDS